RRECCCRTQAEAHENPAEVEHPRRVEVKDRIAKTEMKIRNPARPQIALAEHDAHRVDALDMQRAIGGVDHAGAEGRQYPDQRQQRGDENAGIKPSCHDSSSTAIATASAPPRHSAASPRLSPRS